MVSFQSSESLPDNPVGKKSLGIDAGIESFVATSTGKLFKSPKFLLAQLRKGFGNQTLYHRQLFSNCYYSSHTKN